MTLNWEVELWGFEPQTSCMPFQLKAPLRDAGCASSWQYASIVWPDDAQCGWAVAPQLAPRMRVTFLFR
jgi:hypothetical protein